MAGWMVGAREYRSRGRSVPMETMIEAIERLRGCGYRTHLFAIGGAQLRCSGCGELFGAEVATVDEVVRFEGISNPDDQAILAAIVTPCRHYGLFIAAYGVYTTANDADVLLALTVR